MKSYASDLADALEITAQKSERVLALLRAQGHRQIAEHLEALATRERAQEARERELAATIEERISKCEAP